MKNHQEVKFVTSEADAWFDRNKHVLMDPIPTDHRVIKAIVETGIPQSGCFIDLGGGSGRVAAGLSNLYLDWQGTVLEPSKKAVEAGSKAFPLLNFKLGSMTQKKDMPGELYDLVIIAGVFTWIDRALLSRAIANVDGLVKPGGYVLISDFYSPFALANQYKHKDGLYTYKQDYSLPFLALNLYTELYRKLERTGKRSNIDSDNPYDDWWMTSVLQKDLIGRYRRN